MTANCADEITISPEFPAPQLFLHMRTQAKHLPRRDALDQCYQFCDTVCGNRLHQKMHMILIRTDLHELQLVTPFEIQTDIPQHPVHSLFKYSAAIFRRKHQMIKQHRYIMALMYIFAHANILRSKGRGINPGEI